MEKIGLSLGLMAVFTGIVLARIPNIERGFVGDIPPYSSSSTGQALKEFKAENNGLLVEAYQTESSTPLQVFKQEPSGLGESSQAVEEMESRSYHPSLLYVLDTQAGDTEPRREDPLKAKETEEMRQLEVVMGDLTNLT